MDHLQLTQRQFPTGRRAPATYLDVERNVKLEPDLSWLVDGECVFVGDCKYKRPVGAIPNADIYQMHAYLTALQLRKGLLVYASGEEMPPAATIVEADRSIEVAAIDLSRSLADVIADVGVLVRADTCSVARQGERVVDDVTGRVSGSGARSRHGRTRDLSLWATVVATTAKAADSRGRPFRTRRLSERAPRSLDTALVGHRGAGHRARRRSCSR